LALYHFKQAVPLTQNINPMGYPQAVIPPLVGLPKQVVENSVGG